MPRMLPIEPAHPEADNFSFRKKAELMTKEPRFWTHNSSLGSLARTTLTILIRISRRRSMTYIKSMETKGTISMAILQTRLLLVG
jgi:hypothetical protein